MQSILVLVLIGSALLPNPYKKIKEFQKKMYRMSRYYESSTDRNPWNWTFTGPKGGEVFYAVSHPSANNFALALSGSDVWRTTDGGTTWELSIENCWPQGGMMSSANAGIIVDGGGVVWATLDAGQNWAQVLSTNEFHTASFDVVDTVIYLADSIPPRLWRSTNSGLTWQVVTTFPTLDNVDKIAHIPGSPGTYWLVGHEQPNDTLTYIYFSGVSAFVDTIPVREVLDFQQNPYNIWHTMMTTEIGIFQAASGLGPWTLLAEPFLYGLYQPVDIEFIGPDSIVVSSMYSPGVFRGRRFGGMWIFSQTENRKSAGYMSFGGPSTFYCGTFGVGVFKSVDDGVSWTIHNDLYAHVVFSGGAVSEIPDSSIYFIAFGGIPYKTSDWGTTWTALPGTFLIYGQAIDVAPTNPDFLIATVLGIENIGSPPMTIYRSQNGGTTWSAVDSTYMPGDYLITGDPNIVLAAQNDLVLRSASGGIGFTPVFQGSGVLSNLAGLDTVFVATIDTTFVSYDRGAAWLPLVPRGGELAYDQTRKRLYIAQGKLYTYDLSTGTFDSLLYNAYTPTVSPNGNLYFWFWSDTLRVARSFDGGTTVEEEVFPITLGSGGLRAGDDGVFCYHGLRGFWVSNDITTSIREGATTVPSGLVLFAPTLVSHGNQQCIMLNLQKAQHVSLVLYDISGRRIMDVYQGGVTGGDHLFTYSTGSLAHGVYYLVLTTEQYTMTRKQVIF